jgi:hypothetical protein
MRKSDGDFKPAILMVKMRLKCEFQRFKLGGFTSGLQCVVQASTQSEKDGVCWSGDRKNSIHYF